MSIIPGWFPFIPRVPDPRGRRVGRYDVAYGGTASATVTVPAIDLVFAASPTKQILVAIPTEIPFVSSVTINGVNAPLIVTGLRFIELFSAVYAGSGPFNIVVTIGATSTENADLEVFEFDEAAPLYQGARCLMSQTTGTLVTLPLRVPEQGLAVAAASSTTDTVTSTWSGGVTELSDGDAGDMSLSSAANFVPQTANSSLAILDTISAALNTRGVALAIAPNIILLQGGIRSDSSSTASGTTATFTSLVNFTDLGSFKLIATFSLQHANPITIISATFNGVAMTLIGSVTNTTPTSDISIYAFQIDVTQAAPSGNIVANFSASATGVVVQCYRALVYNVGSVGDIQSGTSELAAGAALQVDVNKGGMIVGVHAHDTDTNTITVSGLDMTGFMGDVGITAGATATRAYCDAEVNRPIQFTASAAASNATLAFALNP